MAPTRSCFPNLGLSHSPITTALIVASFLTLCLAIHCSGCVSCRLPRNDSCTSISMSPTPLIALLERLQDTALSTFGSEHFDPKFYIDLSLKDNLENVQHAFDKLPRLPNGSVPAKELEGFVNENFAGAGDDIVNCVPPDFVSDPEGFLSKVENMVVKGWALAVHSLWKNLSRRVAGSVKERPEWHTLLPLPNPVIIPGSRFREVYYWDSYWVIRGLLVSKMYGTAKSIVSNLMDLLETYGHVLNGARVYYINRSQPPLLSAMVRAIYERTEAKDLAQRALPLLVKEHKFWTTGIHQVTVCDAQGNCHYLSRYYAMWNQPRPESSTSDKKLASNISSIAEKQKIYRELASTAESGWDFSTRWMRNPKDMTTMATTSILPVDLNVYLLKMELDISFLAKVLQERRIAEHFSRASEAREKSINAVFWNESTGQWHDYWLSKRSPCEEGETWEAPCQNQAIFASNFIPIWIDTFHSDENLVKKVVKSLQSSGLLHPAGIATSLTNSGQQWDFPNGWAPLQHMIIEGLAKSKSKEAKALAEDIFVRWIRTNYVAYKKTGLMHEKYDVEKCGALGGGGEYVPQTGFGWSNGVVLALLEEFGWPQDREIGCQ